MKSSLQSKLARLIVVSVLVTGSVSIQAALAVNLQPSPGAPIAQARQSLWRATRDYAARNTVAAKADITNAVNWLDSATKSTDKNTRIEAARLKHRLKNLQGKMDKARSASGSTLLNIWQHSTALAEYEAEKFSMGLGKLHGANEIKADLIGAKLHLAFAASDHFVRGRSREVSNQLSRTEDYLNKAAQASNKVLVVKINEMRGRLKAIRHNLGDRGAQAHVRYKKLMAAMNLIIHNL